jgi:death on curing protein
VTRYLSLAEYLWLAEQVTGIDAAVLTKIARVDLADSALHAPRLVSVTTTSTRT